MQRPDNVGSNNRGSTAVVISWYSAKIKIKLQLNKIDLFSSTVNLEIQNLIKGLLDK